MGSTGQFPKKREDENQAAKRAEKIKERQKEMGYDEREHYEEKYVRKADRGE